MKQNNNKTLDPLADYVFDLLRQGDPYAHLNDDVIEFCESVFDSIGFEPVKFENGVAKKNLEGEIELYPDDCENLWIASWPQED